MKDKIKKIKGILGSQLIDSIYPSKNDLEKILKSGKRLTIYHGIDPTAVSLHLGHSTNFILLKKFQELGHKIIILIGDFTAQIGDPTGRLSARKSLTKKQVLKNCRTYKEQVGKILDFKSKKNPAQIKFNSRWLEKLNLKDVIKLMASFTHGQTIKRNMFQERLKKNQEIFLPEFLYPLLQGYDSVALDVDGEVGGTDQTFNMLAGRTLLRKYKAKEKFVITTPLLENPKTGGKLMSKSEGHYIALNDSPNEMFGKTMALPDEVVIPCIKLCTEINLDEIKKIKNPRELKAKLAREIVTIYHGKKTAKIAEKEFERVFKEKKTPTQIKTIKISPRPIGAKELLVKCNLTKSLSEAQRLIEQGAVSLDNKILKDWRQKIQIPKPTILRVGKYRFVKIIA